mgnify:CR=1 FL=1
MNVEVLMNENLLTVSELNERIKSLIDSDPVLMQVAVAGELSNYKVYPSGHHYFTLKDQQSSVRCVMFRSSASKLRFKPESGMGVTAVGRVSVYPRDGAYQLYCTELIPQGVGDLHPARAPPCATSSVCSARVGRWPRSLSCRSGCRAPRRRRR